MSELSVHALPAELRKLAGALRSDRLFECEVPMLERAAVALEALVLDTVRAAPTSPDAVSAVDRFMKSLNGAPISRMRGFLRALNERAPVPAAPRTEGDPLTEPEWEGLVWSLKSRAEFLAARFGAPVYLVGSVLNWREQVPRDIDIRIVLPDAEWEARFGGKSLHFNAECPPRYIAEVGKLNRDLSAELHRNIDLQIQPENWLVRHGAQDKPRLLLADCARAVPAAEGSGVLDFKHALDKVAQMEGHVSFDAAGEDTRKRIYATVTTVATALRAAPDTERASDGDKNRAVGVTETAPILSHAPVVDEAMVEQVAYLLDEYVNDWQGVPHAHGTPSQRVARIILRAALAPSAEGGRDAN